MLYLHFQQSIVTICIFKNPSVFIHTSKPFATHFPPQLLKLLFWLVHLPKVFQVMMKPLYFVITSRHHSYFNHLARDFPSGLSSPSNSNFLNSDTVTTVLQKPGTHFLLVSTFYPSCSFSSIKIYHFLLPGHI